MCRRPAEDRGERADAVLSPARAVRGGGAGGGEPHRGGNRSDIFGRIGRRTDRLPSGGPVRKTKKSGTAASLRSGLRCGLWPGGAVRRHVPAGAVDVRTKPNRAAVKDSGPIRLCFSWICPSVRNFLSAGRKNVRRPFPFFGIFSGAGRKRYFAGDQQQRWLFGVTTTNL